MAFHYTGTHSSVVEFLYIHLAERAPMAHKLKLLVSGEVIFESGLRRGVPWAINSSGRHGQHTFGWIHGEAPAAFVADFHYAGQEAEQELRRVLFEVQLELTQTLGRVENARVSNLWTT